MLEWHDLNPRQEAMFLWSVTLLAIAMAVSSEVRSSVCALLKMGLNPYIWLPLMGLFADVSIVTAILVIAGKEIGFWETLPVASATIWSLTAGLSLLFGLSDFMRNSSGFRLRVARLLGPSSIITAVVGIAVFHLWVEIFLFPPLILFTVAIYSNRNKGLTVFASILLFAYVVASVCVAVVDLIRNPEEWKPLAQTILLPVALTIGALPYVKLLITLERFVFCVSTKRRTVKSGEYGSEWPLTVSSVKLCCNSHAVWIEVEGRKYQGNGRSRGILEKYGYVCLDLSEMQRDHPEIAGVKISIHPLIRDGLTLDD